MAYKTYAMLTAATDVQSGDLLASWRSTGPMKSLTVGTFTSYLAGSTAFSTVFLARSLNLSDLASASTARTNLGLGSAALLTAGVAANNAVQLNGSAQLPALDGSLLSGTGLKGRNAQTANYTVVATDASKVVACTGTFNLTLLAAATALAPFAFIAQNAGAGAITLLRSSADTIDGATTYVMQPGEARLFTTDGVSAWSSIIIAPFFAILTAGAAFPVGPGYATIDGLLWGGGGGGANGGGGSSTSNSGGGACVPFSIPAATYGTTQTVTIAATAAASSSYMASAGNSSSIGSLVTASGAGTGGATSGGKAGGVVATGVYDGGSGNSALYGGAGAPAALGVAVAANVSTFAGASGNTVASGTAGNGVAPGGGGGNSYNGTGGIGARGECRIWGRVA